TMPEGRTQFLTHHSERLVWPPAMLDHPNGAQSLNALWIAAADPAEPVARFARFTGRPARQDGAVTTIAPDPPPLPRPAHAPAPAYRADEFGIAPAGAMPCPVAAEIGVASLDVLEACLAGSGLGFRRAGSRIVVTLPPALGDALIFRTG